MTARHLAASLVLLAVAAVPAAAQPPFDHAYASWDGLLRRHVHWLADGVQSRVDYDGFVSDRAALADELRRLSGVDQREFERWSRAQQMAFLVNAYNAFTIDLVLTGWPGLASIQDLGSFLRRPWRRRFFALLGAQRHLDWIEHDQLRAGYREPRVHAALNCASIGCPALRPEAFVAARLDEQLDDGMRRFLSDRTRNRVANGRLEVSAIFRWYRADFTGGDGGFHRLEDVFARYADALSADPGEQAALRARRLRVTFLDYDWSLNAIGR